MAHEEASDEEWLADVRASVAAKAPESMPLFEVYEGEARFGRRFIERDLSVLPHGAAILEVGAGCMLLSCQLVREGYDVTALEPGGSGFSHLSKLRSLVMERAAAMNCMPSIVDRRVEDLSVRDGFDYAFSINVMEHVDDIQASLVAICDAVKSGGACRFTCPNYLFPYEPHFNMPTLWSKTLTGIVMQPRIRARESLPDAAGVWASLNWINPWIIRRSLADRADVRVAFDRRVLVRALERLTTDPGFAKRRSPVVARALAWLVGSGMHRAFGLFPAATQPLIDCALTKLGHGETRGWGR